ncbi:transposase [Amycolatopsis thermoflava]
MLLAPGKGGCAPGVETLAVDREGLGRSRGGLNTKIHLAVDGRGLPLRVLLTGGHAGDNPQPLPLLDGIAVARIGPGRPRCRPELVVADKACSHPSTRQATYRTLPSRPGRRSAGRRPGSSGRRLHCGLPDGDRAVTPCRHARYLLWVTPFSGGASIRQPGLFALMVTTQCPGERICAE